MPQTQERTEIDIQTELPEVSVVPNIPRRSKTQEVRRIEKLNGGNIEEESEEENIINNEENEDEEENDSGSSGDNNNKKNENEEEIEEKDIIIGTTKDKKNISINIRLLLKQMSEANIPVTNPELIRFILEASIVSNLCQIGVLQNPQCNIFPFLPNTPWQQGPMFNNPFNPFQQQMPMGGYFMPQNGNFINQPTENSGLNSTKKDSNSDKKTEDSSLPKKDEKNEEKNEEKKEEKPKTTSTKSETSVNVEGLLPILITGGLTATAMYVCPIMAPLALVAFLVFLCKNPESLLGQKKDKESKKEEEKKKEPVKTPKKDEKSEEKSESSEKQEKKDQKTQNEIPKNQNQEKSGPTTDPLPEPPNRNTQKNEYFNKQREYNKLSEQKKNLKKTVENIENAEQDMDANIPYQQIPIKA